MKNKSRIHFLINSEIKDNWKEKAMDSKLNLTDFIINKVEDNLTRKEVNTIVNSIEDITNFRNKVDNNINQVTRIINIDKSISEKNMMAFNALLEAYIEKVSEQNEKIRKLINRLYSNPKK
jgi:archaellum component FlaC